MARLKSQVSRPPQQPAGRCLFLRAGIAVTSLGHSEEFVRGPSQSLALNSRKETGKLRIRPENQERSLLVQGTKEPRLGTRRS